MEYIIVLMLFVMIFWMIGLADRVAAIEDELSGDTEEEHAEWKKNMVQKK